MNVGAGNPAVTEPAATSIEEGSGDEREVNVNAGATASVFEGKVFVAVLEIAQEGENAHSTVTLRLSSDDAGVGDKRLKRVDAGYSYSYNGFRVRVMSVEKDHARFRVPRLLAEATPTSGPRH